MSYKPGDHLAICDRCGFRHLASEMKMEWNGFFVCTACWEPRHEQYVEPTGRHEKQRVKPCRPEVDPVFLNPGDVTPDDL